MWPTFIFVIHLLVLWTCFDNVRLKWKCLLLQLGSQEDVHHLYEKISADIESHMQHMSNPGVFMAGLQQLVQAVSVARSTMDRTSAMQLVQKVWDLRGGSRRVDACGQFRGNSERFLMFLTCSTQAWSLVSYVDTFLYLWMSLAFTTNWLHSWSWRSTKSRPNQNLSWNFFYEMFLLSVFVFERVEVSTLGKLGEKVICTFCCSLDMEIHGDTWYYWLSNVNAHAVLSLEND